MADKKLSDEEILRLIDDFYNLSNETREGSLRVGRGTAKTVYNLPNSEYVLKEMLGAKDRANENAALDYLAHKQLSKQLPVEQPILVTRENKPSVLLQKKLMINGMGEQLSEGSRKFNSILKDAGVEKYSADIHPGNIGIDRGSSNPKVLDTSLFRFEDDNNNTSLNKARETISQKLGSPTKTKIYRSIPIIGPAIGAGLAAMSGEANAESTLPLLGEAESLGPEAGSEDYAIENPQANPEARRKALESLLKK
jgi:hypothetical protein